MINEIRAQALAHAMELSRIRMVSEASDIVRDASVFEAYLAGHITSLTPIDDVAGSIEPSLDLGSRDRSILNGHGGNVLSVSVGQTGGNKEDQPLAGCDVTGCAHSNSSSVQDGESVGELPTPSRTETVAATGDTKEAARTHGGAA